MKKNERPFIQQMFNRIAPWYDFLNRLLSLNQDVLWRKKAVSSLSLKANSRVLDVACGTCDVSLEVIKQNKTTSVVASDFSMEMLKIAAKKVSASGFGGKIRLILANGLMLPFWQESFDGVTIAFGIRNIVDRKTALENFYQVLKPDGKLAVLELTTPSGKFLQALYLIYFTRILPLIGGLFSKNFHAYSYLPESVINFPEPDEFVKLIEDCGFDDVNFESLTFGVCTLFTGIKK